MTQQAENKPGVGSQSAGFQGAGQQMEEVLHLMAVLRSSCPWVKEQTHASIMRYLPEETYEVVEAVEDPAGTNLPLLKEELGDVLLNIVFHAQLASEVPRQEGGFGMEDVAATLAAKLVRRNPHVFGPTGGQGPDGLSSGEIDRAWKALKEAEKPERTGPFDGLPPALPALALAAKVGERAQRAGLEPAPAPEGLPSFASEEELGAYLFGLVTAASEAGLDAERALRGHLRSITGASTTG